MAMTAGSSGSLAGMPRGASVPLNSLLSGRQGAHAIIARGAPTKMGTGWMLLLAAVQAVAYLSYRFLAVPPSSSNSRRAIVCVLACKARGVLTVHVRYTPDSCGGLSGMLGRQR